MLVADAEVAVVGAGVVGAAVALTLARRAVRSPSSRPSRAAALAASGTNSGILHTGFDSVSRRARDGADPALGRAPRRGARCARRAGLRCGAVMRGDPGSLRRYADGASATASRSTSRTASSRCQARRSPTRSRPHAGPGAGRRGAGRGGAHRLPGATEWSRASGCVQTQGEEVCGRRGGELRRAVRGRRSRASPGTSGSRSIRARGSSWSSTPGEPLERILLPVPEPGTKGVLVFPTVDGQGGGRADRGRPRGQGGLERAPGRSDQVVRRGPRMCPPLAGSEPIAAYAGLRPAGRGFNYLDRALARVRGTGQRRGHPLHRADGLARDRRAGGGARGRRSGSRSDRAVGPCRRSTPSRRTSHGGAGRRGTGA